MKKIDWHAGFVSAMKLEFVENEKDLIYDEEHHVANRAQRIDLLIIKNNNNVKIRNPIGAIFAGYNICEYKGPDQSLTYSDFYKVIAYTSLYLGETQKSENHDSAEYTMTFVRESHPYSLFKRIANDGIIITDRGQGIYRLTNNLPFATQVIVTKEIPDVNRSWIKCLTKRGTISDLDTIMANTPKLDDHNKSFADNVMDIFTSANTRLVKEQIKEPAMCNAVNELFADQIKEKEIIIANMGTQLANKDSQIANMGTQLADKDSQIANMGTQLANKDSQIAELQAKLDKYARLHPEDI